MSEEDEECIECGNVVDECTCCRECVGWPCECKEDDEDDDGECSECGKPDHRCICCCECSRHPCKCDDDQKLTKEQKSEIEKVVKNHGLSYDDAKKAMLKYWSENK